MNRQHTSRHGEVPPPSRCKRRDYRQRSLGAEQIALSEHAGFRAVVAGLPPFAAAHGTISCSREPGHAIRDGAVAGEPGAAAVRMTGREWRRRWQWSRPVSSALVDQSSLPRGGAGGHDAELLRELHEQHAGARWSGETEIDRIPDQPIGHASDALVSRHLVAAALGRLTQQHRDVLGELYLRGSSVAQAAHALGIAPGTVKSRTYYALRALQLAIEELGGIE